MPLLTVVLGGLLVPACRSPWLSSPSLILTLRWAATQTCLWSPPSSPGSSSERASLCISLPTSPPSPALFLGRCGLRPLRPLRTPPSAPPCCACACCARCGAGRCRIPCSRPMCPLSTTSCKSTQRHKVGGRAGGRVGGWLAGWVAGACGPGTGLVAECGLDLAPAACCPQDRHRRRSRSVTNYPPLLPAAPPPPRHCLQTSRSPWACCRLRWWRRSRCPRWTSSRAARPLWSECSQPCFGLQLAAIYADTLAASCCPI